MSGPKTHSYRLTEEQRRELQRLREREIKRQKDLAVLHRHRLLAGGLLKKAAKQEALCEALQVHLKQDGGLSSVINEVKHLAEEVQKLAFLPDTATYEEVEAVMARAKELFAETEQKEKALDDLAREEEALLMTTLENKIEQGFQVSFASLEERIDTRKLLQSRLERLAAIEALSPTFRGKIHEAKALLADCKEENFKNFEALTLLPLEKEARLAEESYEKVKKRYLPLRDAYVALCEVREVPPMETECTEEGIAILEKAIEQLEGIIRCDDEEGYIAECLDQVMEEMGYHVVGERHQQKRSGRRFRHELYTYKDGMVVDVTTADDGKITMELGATDTVDRLPTRSEEKELCHSMEEFCVDFAEIEKRLAEMGIEVKERISHLPPTADYAQIINLTDYEMKEAIPEQKKQATSEGEVLRRRQRKRKLLRRAL